MSNVSIQRKIELLEQVKPIRTLPKLDVLTTDMADMYFGMSKGRCSNAICTGKAFRGGVDGSPCLIHITKDMLIQSGYRATTVCNGVKEYALDDTRILYGNLTRIGLTKEAMVYLAEMFKKAPVAIEYRKLLQKEMECSESGNKLESETPIAPEAIAVQKSESAIVVEPIIAEDSESALTVSEMNRMESEKQISLAIHSFISDQFGEIRTITKDGEPWFVAADVCRALEISNSRDAVARLDEDEKNTVVLTDGNRGNPNMTIVNEPGLYTLVLGSRKPEAKAFKRWITHEVIPMIRKHGAYMTPEKLEEALLNPDVMIKLMKDLKQERKLRQQAEWRERLAVAKSKILMVEAQEWDYIEIINALMRKCAASHFAGQFQLAYDELHRQIRYKHGIALKNRKKAKNASWLSTAKPEELPKIAQVAATICESRGTDISDVINDVNAKIMSRANRRGVA